MPKEIFYRIVQTRGEKDAGEMHSQAKAVAGKLHVYSFPFIDGQWHVTVVGTNFNPDIEARVDDVLKIGLPPTASKGELQALKERQIFALPEKI